MSDIPMALFDEGEFYLELRLQGDHLYAEVCMQESVALEGR